MIIYAAINKTVLLIPASADYICILDMDHISRHLHSPAMAIGCKLIATVYRCGVLSYISMYCQLVTTPYIKCTNCALVCFLPVLA